MGKLKTITRRAFLVGTAAVAGGVTFGTYMVNKPHDNPLADDLADTEASFNPWVKISKDGITLITPHADIGQGAKHVQALLLAEELDVNLDQIKTDFGTPSPAYWNTAMGNEGAPFLSTDESIGATAARSMMTALIKVLGMQITGGSSTVPDSFDKLRQAAASARETLKLAAANRTGIEVDKLRTENAQVILPDGTAMSYTDLAAEAASFEPVQNVNLRNPDQWRLIGKPTERLDTIAKSTGRAQFGIDLKLPGLVYAAVKTNPRQGAPMNSFNADSAKSMRGVKQIVPLSNGAAVVADNTWRAFQAVNQIEFDWAEADYPANMDGHWELVESSFQESRLDKLWRDEGDAVTALADTAPITASYKAPYVAHQPLEPLNVTIQFDGKTAEVWTGHQIPQMVQQQVANVLGIEPTAVAFHNQMSGGSFGHRLEFEHIKQAAEIALELQNTPIKLTYSREEDFAHDFPRQIGMARAQGKVSNGHIEAIDIQVATASSSRSQMGRSGMALAGPDSQIVAGVWNLPYNIEHLRVRGYAVEGVAPTSSWRSVGASSGGFFIESFIDELIHAAEADPLAERIRLANTSVTRQVLEAVGELSNWGSEMGANRARGIACVESFGVTCAQVVEVSLQGDKVKIDRVYVVADVGQIVDPVNFENQVQGGVVWGLGHAMNCEITYQDGMAQQSNFHMHTGIRIQQCPEIIVKGLENAQQVKGIGEPPVPPAAPALANAIFALTGQRLREMPFNKSISFV
ncbi:MAG: xanthine dehydrogenase family protein molybdopterin-binding subunit [Gammaproteobacteria bacterium]|nr:xanthine dehydrogenase family protein molybdopterin-binding subunit [Gammaproteobacteria bacterium]